MEAIILIFAPDLFERHRFERSRTNDIQSQSYFALRNIETFVQFEALWKRNLKHHR